MCEKAALLLQTIGFGITAILVGVIKWNVLKPALDELKSIICKTPLKLKRLRQYWSSTVASLFLPMILRFAKIEKKEPETITIETNVIIEYVLYPLYTILCLSLAVPIFIVAFFAKILSGHNTMTNILVIIGTTMLFAGLLMELILNW